MLIIKKRYFNSWWRSYISLDGTTLTAEKNYLININKNNKKFCLSFHYNGANSFLFVNGTNIIKFKAKDSKIVATPLCLGNISKDFSVDNMKKAGLNGYVCIDMHQNVFQWKIKNVKQDQKLWMLIVMNQCFFLTVLK